MSYLPEINQNYEMNKLYPYKLQLSSRSAPVIRHYAMLFYSLFKLFGAPRIRISYADFQMASPLYSC